MKKFLHVLTFIAAASVIPASAQLKVFNHLGADLSVSTTGIGIELSTPITDFVQMRAGVSFMPGFSFKSSYDGSIEVVDNSIPSTGTTPASKDVDFTMDLKGDFGRTQGNVIFNIYPMGRMSKFFVAAGAYFGGNSIMKLTGHSPEVEQYQANKELLQGYVDFGDYNIDFEDGGKISGAMVVNKFRPYVGLGFGRPCPKGRLGFMVEAGVQFMGKMKVCQGADLTPIELPDVEEASEVQKWIDKLTVYPVLKFTLSGRIF